MTRLLAISILLFAGLSQIGFERTDMELDCFEQACSVPVVQVSCCGQPAEPQYCPMSDGPCQCSIAPAPEPNQQLPAPLPKANTLTFVTILNSPPPMVVLLENQSPSFQTSGLINLLDYNSHNQRQASLGVWRL